MHKIIQSCGDPKLDQVFLHWSLTNWCNYKCSYCSVYDAVHSDFSKPDHTALHNLSLARINAISSDFNMCITGGEPTLHPQFVEIITALVKMDHCLNVAVFTNLSRSENYYRSLEQINSSKLGICASYHPEFSDVNKFISKAKAIASTTIPFSVQVSMTSDPKDWPTLQYLMDQMFEQQIPCFPILLNKTPHYTPNYTEEFYRLFKPYMEITPVDKQFKEIECTFTDGTRSTMRDFDIEIQQMNRFKGYKCTPRTFQITISGTIQNSCTGRPIPLNGKNIVREEICPVEVCPGKRMLTFYKEKV